MVRHVFYVISSDLLTMYNHSDTSWYISNLSCSILTVCQISAPISHQFVVTSRGLDDGRYCNIVVNGIEEASQGRGFCVVGFDPNSLEFKNASFDTYDDPDRQVYSYV